MICKSTPGRIVCIFMILLSFSTRALPGTNDKNKDFEKIFNLIYNQEFDQANIQLIQSRNKLDKWEYQVLDLDLLWWEALSGDSREDYERFESALKIYSSDLKQSRSPDNLEELINLSYSFRLAALKGNLFTMMLDFVRINHIIQKFETDRLTTEQKQVFKIYMGLFNIGKSKLLFNNSKLREEGIEILESNINSANPVYQTLSCYFLSKIYLELDKTPSKARIYCEQLCNAYPTNKIFIYNLELCNNHRSHPGVEIINNTKTPGGGK
ncbi:MAG: hypothetical protein JW965_09840 [Bacteroidales bacterium]|nr:hypothetical protein [Bacteroidales bacterium]